MPVAARELSRRAYRASVAFVDEQIARIMATLENEGLKERTFILYTSDHGDGQGRSLPLEKGVSI